MQCPCRFLTATFLFIRIFASRCRDHHRISKTVQETTRTLCCDCPTKCYKQPWNISPLKVQPCWLWDGVVWTSAFASCKHNEEKKFDKVRLLLNKEIKSLLPSEEEVERIPELWKIASVCDKSKKWPVPYTRIKWAFVNQRIGWYWPKKKRANDLSNLKARASRLWWAFKDDPGTLK